MGESEIEDGLYFTTKVQASRVDRVFTFGWCRTATYNPELLLHNPLLLQARQAD